MTFLVSALSPAAPNHQKCPPGQPVVRGPSGGFVRTLWLEGFFPGVSRFFLVFSKSFPHQIQISWVGNPADCFGFQLLGLLAWGVFMATEVAVGTPRVQVVESFGSKLASVAQHVVFLGMSFGSVFLEAPKSEDSSKSPKKRTSLSKGETKRAHSLGIKMWFSCIPPNHEHT